MAVNRKALDIVQGLRVNIERLYEDYGIASDDTGTTEARTIIIQLRALEEAARGVTTTIKTEGVSKAKKKKTEPVDEPEPESSIDERVTHLENRFNQYLGRISDACQS